MSKLSLGLVAALAAAPAFAQSTSAGVGGVVTDAGGAPVAGAEVTITHVESGTVSRATTDANGRYNARGLRVGGPYTITVTKAGAGTDTEDGIYLDLNKVNTVNAALKGDVTTLETVTAIGVAGGSSVFSATKMGTGTSVDQETIQALPSINGNIQDYMRLDPRVAFVDRASGTISAGGLNPRFNSVSIDGVSASDTFGLEGNNMPTKRQPVSMEAIEAIDINLSNYDVTSAGAAGATVNAVTKSGTNEFHGSLYGYMRDGDWFGDNPNSNNAFAGFDKEETYGATFGGPIVKDKLFFFANYEKYEQATPGTSVDFANYDFSEADVAEAQRIARDVWGFEPGGTTASNSNTTLEEYALKLDWNINDDHRANLRYSKLEQAKVRPEGSSASTLALSSSWFVHEKTVESYVGQLFSDWTDTFSTEFKVSYRDYSAIRVVPTVTPQISIYFGGDETAPSGDLIRMGTERSSQNNVLKTETWNYFGAGTWTVGDHDIKFGVDYSENEIFNYFAQDGWGNYTFYGLDNFEAGIWSTYAYKAETSPGSIPAQYKNKNLGLFIQDTWYATPNLTLTFGVRGDRPETSPAPEHNAVAEADWGLDNSQTYSGDFVIQPRFGFNYTFDSERPTQLRGGIGLFQGDAPQVWVGNSYSNTGLNAVSYSQDIEDEENYEDLPFSPDGHNQPVPSNPAAALMDVNFMAKDFELPSVWKANLAFDHELPWYGIVGSAEVILTDVNNGLFYRTLNVGPGYIGPDGRVLYYDPAREGRAWSSSNARFGRNPAYNNVFLIDNTSKGKSQQFTASLSKPWSEGSDWSWNLAYTYTHATEVGSLTSSTASSGFGYQYGFNINEDVARNGRYVIKDRISGSLDWKHKFFGDYETRAGLVYEGRSGRPFSYVFVNDANGDSRTANDLFYVPSAPGDVLFGTLTSAGVFTPDPAMEQSFFEWLNQNPELKRYAGNYAPANAFRADWVNTFDLRISQELPGFFKGHKSQIWVDIQNVGNLLNKDWGHIYDYGFFADARVATLQGIYDGKYVYNYRFADAPSVANNDADGVNTGVSQWSLQVGLKYEF
ncbi:TonB-dependent receptor [Pseudoxanthomonas sangjuensis]|uniref:TonB-dependent receptor n=1 Tax=Pseudoxanthomonas sangjuensis TaxID=1503750 RepID=UPI0013919054|nr:TonB-dependent receptor [Pseudoxanthomonas sangjuensis]KAF1706528.1 Oar protein [Pseudoxanthomonas sangjuensis]